MTNMLEGLRGSKKGAALVFAAALLVAPLVALVVFALLAGTAGAQTTPGNGKIAFQRDTFSDSYVYVTNPDGTGQTSLSGFFGARDYEPAFSPDGSKIAFASNRIGFLELYVMNANGSGQTRLTFNREINRDPAYSPNGTRIVFSSNRNGVPDDIYAMNAGGSGQTRLTDDPARDMKPAYAPDGTKIVFQSDRDGNDDEIYVMDANGTNQRPLTDNAVTDTSPTYAPDGSKIAFARRGEIYTMNADGTNETNLTNNPASDSQPAFSPDGTRIAFVSNRDSGADGEIYVMNADGSNETRLTFDGSDDKAPSWGGRVNAAPVANGQSVTTNEDEAKEITLSATDSDGDNLTFRITAPATRGTLGPIGPTTCSGAAPKTCQADVTYTPNADFAGPDSFGFRASDGATDSGEATVSVAVNAVNDTPAAEDDAYTTDEDQTLNVPAPGVLANDTDAENDSLTARLVDGPSEGGLDLHTDGSFTYVPNPDFGGATDSFSYRANDGAADGNVATVTIKVNPINDAPVANDDAAATDEDTAVDIPVLANDGDPDGGTNFSLQAREPAHGTATVNPDKTIRYEPNPGYSGSDTFEYLLSDGSGETDSATVTVTVKAVNDAPAANDDAAATDENTATNVSVLANDGDPDGDALTVQSASDPAHGTAAVNPDSTVRYQPDANYSGPDSFSYTVSDGQGGTDTATVSVTVRDTTPPGDTTPPTVVRVSPPGGATGVLPGANVTATFSETMNRATLNGTTVRLVRKGTTRPTAATAGYNAATRTVVINPSANLTRGATYTATVTTGAKDLAGNTLDQNPAAAGNQPRAWSFTVRR